MAYPRDCPTCEIAFQGENFLKHVTLATKPGGTPSPWVPESPGRIMRLKCMVCGNAFDWDYFGNRAPDAQELQPASRDAA